MPKTNKRNKSAPNTVVFLVEGESDQIALENPLSELIFDKNPDYEVRFLLQQKVINSAGDEVDDEENEDDEDTFLDEDEYESGGDITTSSFVTPENIVRKIENRFIKPVTKAEGLYPRRIAMIYHIVDMDGAYIPEDCVIPFAPERAFLEKPYYDGERGVIEARDVVAIRERNERKQKNLDYLISLSSQGIKIGSRTIPYEIYFFSSNLDHVINNNANLDGGKRALADAFLRKFGLYPDRFCQFFSDKSIAIGHKGYYESWEEIKTGANSVRRLTNLDFLIRSLRGEFI